MLAVGCSDQKKRRLKIGSRRRNIGIIRCRVTAEEEEICRDERVERKKLRGEKRTNVTSAEDWRIIY